MLTSRQQFEVEEQQARALARQVRLGRCRELGVPEGTSPAILATFEELPEYVRRWVQAQPATGLVLVGNLRREASRWETLARMHGPDGLSPSRSLWQRHLGYAEDFGRAAEIAEGWEVRRLLE